MGSTLSSRRDISDNVCLLWLLYAQVKSEQDRNVEAVNDFSVRSDKFLGPAFPSVTSF